MNYVNVSKKYKKFYKIPPKLEYIFLFDFYNLLVIFHILLTTLTLLCWRFSISLPFYAYWAHKKRYGILEFLIYSNIPFHLFAIFHPKSDIFYTLSNLGPEASTSRWSFPSRKNFSFIWYKSFFHTPLSARLWTSL